MCREAAGEVGKVLSIDRGKFYEHLAVLEAVGPWCASQPCRLGAALALASSGKVAEICSHVLK